MNVNSVWDLEVEGFTSVGGNCPYHGYWTTTTTTMTETMTTTETMNDEIDDDGIDNDDDNNNNNDEDDIEDYLKLCGKRISTTFPARV